MSTTDDFEGLLDPIALDKWIQAQDLPGSGPVTDIEKLPGGSQNNLFLLSRGDARMVLRRPPRHLRRNSNNTMLREARVLGALAGSEVPHPRFYAVCDDESVIGTCFYIMEPIEGFTPMGQLPGTYATDPAWRQRLAFEMAEAAAKLGAVDHEKVGLADYGKPDNWLGRQVGRWRSQLEGYGELEGYEGPADMPNVDQVGKWLDSNLPAEHRIGIIHGDLQFANVMFAPAEPKLAALIDWELSTLGDPLLDLAWILTAWHEEGDPPGRGESFQPWDGVPTRAEMVQRYGEVSGRDMGSMPWFFVLGLYKLGILLEGTKARADAGQAPVQIGESLHGVAVWLFAKADQVIAKGV